MQVTPEFIENPFPTYERMRESGRMHWNSANAGSWIFPRYQDVKNFLQKELFSTQMKAESFVNQFPKEVRGDYAEFSRFVKMWIVLLDGDKHYRLRKLMNKSFTPTFLAAMRPKIQAIVDELIEKMRGQDELDFMSNFAKVFPAKVIASMLGVKEDNYSDFTKWADAIVDFTGSLSPTLEMLHEANHGLQSMIAFFRKQLPSRRANKGDDLISLLVKIEENGDLLTEDEVVANCAQLVFAGHETTRNLVSTGLYELLRNPAEKSKLLADPGLMMKNAVREMMRFHSPLQMVKRVAGEDMELFGNQIKRGHGIILLLQSANRDESVFTNPNEFKIDRENAKDNLALGFGPHVCLGASLAHLEAEIAFSTLFKHFPNIKLGNRKPTYNSNPFLRGFKEFTVALR